MDLHNERSGNTQMMLKTRRSIGLLSLTILSTCLADCAQVRAQVKPFKISGMGVAPQGFPLPGAAPHPHDIVGQATHLGRHVGVGAVQIDPDFQLTPLGDIYGTFGSAVPFEFIGANGDVLSCHFGRTDFGASVPGTYELIYQGDGTHVAFFVAEFVPSDQCTGKFAGVTGNWTMYAMTDPFVLGSSDSLPYSWFGAGKLTFAKKKK